MSNATIAYNRKQGQWEVCQGDDLVTFPPGKEGEAAARQQYLKFKDPQAYGAAYYLAYDLFRGIVPLQERIWRAAAIVAAGGVRPPYQVGEEPHTVARVKNQTKANTPQHNLHYIVKRSPASHRYACGCFDFINDAAPKVQGQKLCKHILAHKIMKIINRDLPAWPPLDPKILRLRELEAEKEKRLEERRCQNRIAQAKRVANRGPNIHEENRKQARQDGDGARQWARTAAANGTMTTPVHIHNRLAPSEETEQEKARVLAELFPEKYGETAVPVPQPTGEEIDDWFSYD